MALLVGADDSSTGEIAAVITALGVLLGVLFGIYKYVSKGRTRRDKNRIGAVLLVVFVLFGIGAAFLLARGGDEKGEAGGTTTTGSSASPQPAGMPVAQYKQRLGGICDDLQSVDADRGSAEKTLDATSLITAWKDYLGHEIPFSDLSPPATLKEQHDEADETWNRHGRVLLKLTHMVNDDRSPEAMKKVLASPTGRLDDRLRQQVASKLVDLAGSACNYDPD